MWLVPTRWLYAPLDPSRRQIRLLEILPVWKTDRQTPISARLVIVSLDDEPDYSALSYTWGDGTTTNHIIVDGKRIGCTANLHHALNDLRSNPWDVIKKTPKRIWVDAVCINQEDLEEKNHQLPLMETIYTKAKVVYCWLGRPDPIIERGMSGFMLFFGNVARMEEPTLKNYAASLEWLKEYPSIAKEDSKHGARPNQCLSAMNHILQLPYFKRVWIFQELTLAKNAMLLCGGKLFPFDSYFAVSQWLSAVQRFAREPWSKPEHVDANVWTYLMGMHVAFLQRVKSARELVQWRQEFPRKLCGPSFLLTFYAIDQQATNPKDYVYGYSGVTGLFCVRDYSPRTSVATVYVDFVRRWLQFWCKSMEKHSSNTGPVCALWFLGNAGIGYHWTPLPELPSWAPNFVGIATATFPDHSRIPVTHASQADRDVFPKPQAMPYLQHDTLFCSAVLTGKVKHIGPRVLPGWDSVSELMRWLRDYITRPRRHKRTGWMAMLAAVQALQRNTFKDTDGLPDNASLVPFTAMLYRFGYLEEVVDTFLAPYDLWRLEMIQIAKTFNDVNFSDERPPEFLRSEDLYTVPLATTHGLRIAETESGQVGVFPPKVQEGDLVAVLHGCWVPVVLRPEADASYTSLGTCFVSGLMNGEAAGLVRGGDLEVTQISIR